MQGAQANGGQPLSPAPVTYTDANGQSTTVLAFPGQVFLIVDPQVVADATQLVQQNGGSVLAMIPAAGEYWISTGVGNEGTFITAVQGLYGVSLAAPDTPISVSGDVVNLAGATSLAPISLKEPIAQFDDFTPTSNPCGSHGDEVHAVLTQNGVLAARYGVGWLSSDPLFGLARLAQGAATAGTGTRLVMNMSLQSGSEPNDEEDRSGCETMMTLPQCTKGTCGVAPDGGLILCGGNYASWKAAQLQFIASIANLVQHFDPAVRDNTLVVLAAGNSGMNLASGLGALAMQYPDAFAHMLIVGSNDAPAGEGHNFSSHDGDMIYAHGFGVAIPGQPGCVVDGTSFAAPAVANLAAQLSAQFPTLTTAQLVAAIRRAGPYVNGRLSLPSLNAASIAAKRPPVTADFSCTVTSLTGCTLAYTTNGTDADDTMPPTLADITNPITGTLTNLTDCVAGAQAAAGRACTGGASISPDGNDFWTCKVQYQTPVITNCHH